MIQVRRCNKCWRFRTSVGRWVEISEKDLVGVLIEPDVKIVHEVCPDCQVSVSKKIVKIETKSG